MNAAVPIRGRKAGASKAHTPVETPDSVQSTAYAKLLLALGEGEFAGGLAGQDIYLDGTPLLTDGSENFPGVTWEFRPGTVEQEHIAGMPSVENEIAVGVELRSDTPWVRAVTDTQLSAVRIRLGWPALQQQKDNGDIVGYAIDYAIDLATDGGTYQQVATFTLSAKTTSLYERTHRIDLPASSSGWQVRVRRLTANQDNNRIADTMRVQAITEVVDAKLRYPNTALLFVQFDASQFQNIPQVAADVKGRKVCVPSNYDPVSRTYTGVWDGAFQWAWTDNPAWVWYDMVLSERFGLGRRIDQSQVDKWNLYEIAQYCDQLVSDGQGGLEPRFTCNVYFQSRAEAWTVLRDLSAIFRGLSYWADSQMFAMADMPRDIDYVYTRANAIDGRFVYASASEKSRHTMALVSYDDPDNGYQSAVEVASDPALVRRYGVNQVELTAIGCTRRSEANRRGRWALLTNSRDRTVEFSVGLDGQIPLPGRIIGVADELLAGRPLGGRISAVAGRTITLDRDAQVATGDRLVLNLPSGVAEGRTVESVAGRAVTVTTDYSEVPVDQAAWSIDAADLAIQQYRVTGISEPQPGIYKITGIQHDPGKYALVDSGARLEARPISVVPPSVQSAPTGITVDSYTSIDQGMAVTTLRAQWVAAPNAVAYEAEWRKDSGQWISVPRTTALGFEVPGIYAGRYLVRVRAINALDVASLPASSAETQLNGKEGAPPAVSALMTTAQVFGIRLDWAFPAGAEDTQRTEIRSNATPVEEGAQHLGDYAYPLNTNTLTGLAAGVTRYFQARLVDRTGNIGPWSDWVMGQSSADATEILGYLADQISEAELGQTLNQRIDLIDAAASVPGSVNARVADAKSTAQSALDSAVSTLNQDLADQEALLTGQLDALSAQVGDIMQADEWVQTSAYPLGDLVQSTGKLYRALQNVPAGTPLTDITYWQFIGNYSSLGNAVGDTISRVNVHDNRLNSLDGEVSAVAEDLSALSVTVGGKADGSALSAVEQRVTTAEGTINSQGSAITQLQNGLRDGEFDSVKAWQFDTAGNVEGWGSQGATLSVTGGVLTYTTTAYDAQMIKAGLSIDGARYPILRIKLARLSGADQNFQLFYANSTHGYTEANSKKATLAATNGVYQVYELDMSTVGDWSTSTITALRLDIGQAGDSNYAIDWIAVGRKAPAASSAAVSALESRVTATEGSVSSQGSSITSLQNSLSTTNGNVSAAQSAADAAAVLAGSKGKVMVQGTAPAAADQLAQNLWIDITNGANTPKRWNGSAWVAVTDKVATDAAAAAANALSVANTKADASTVSSLQSTVTQQGTTLSSQGDAITALQNSVSQKADASALTALSQQVTNDETTLSSQGTAITTLQNNLLDGDFDAAQTWQFDTAGNMEGWAGANVTLSASGGKLHVVGSAVDPMLISPTLSLAGVTFTHVRAKITRVAGSNWDGALHYATAGHSWSGSYRKILPNPNLAIGTSVVLEWDMTQLTAGGTDWVDSLILRLRFDLGTDSTDSFDIDWISIGRKAPAASSTALNSLTSRVTAAEGSISSQGTSITSLQNSLTTTNTNVTAAQSAAEAAAVLAGSKGKVLVQSTAPAAADQLAQNLWIDITNGANTPKRWNGSAWAAVTDKVATDAAAAAANALSVANTKADASTVSSLQSTVTSQGNTLTSQGNSITTLNNQIKGIGGDNLLPNSSFEEVSGTAGRAKHWLGGSTGTGPLTLSLVASPQPLSTVAQRVENSSLAATKYIDISLTNTEGLPYPAVSPLKSYVLSVDARGLAGLTFCLYIQFLNGSGAVIATPTSAGVSITETFTRYSLSGVAPSGTVRAKVYAGRVINNTGATVAAWMEVDNVQFQEGVVATAYLPSAKLGLDAQQAALSSLSSTVTQQGNTLASHGQAVTQLQSDLTGKADASAVSNLSTTVTQQGEEISSTAQRLDTVQATVAAENLLQNPEFALDASGWIGEMGPNCTFGLEQNPLGILPPGVMAIAQSDAASDLYALVRQRIFVEPGKVYQASAYTGAYQCWLTVDLMFYDQAGNVLLDGPNAANNGDGGGGQTEADWQRIYVNTTAPAGSAYADFRIVKYGTTAGANSVARFTRALCCVVDSEQAALVPYRRSYSAVQQAFKAVNGLRASWMLRTDVNGRVAGMGLENDGYTSAVGFRTDMFYISDPDSTADVYPFVFTGGQLFLNSAVISQADIINLIVTGTLQSANYVAGQSGVRINFITGEFEMNGNVPGKGRSTQTNQWLKYWDENDTLRAQFGYLGA